MQVGKTRHPRQLGLNDSASGLQGGAQDQIFSRNLLLDVFLFHLEKLAGCLPNLFELVVKGQGEPYVSSQ